MSTHAGALAVTVQVPRQPWLLRVRNELPCDRPTDKRYEFALVHSITSSARASSAGGIGEEDVSLNLTALQCCVAMR
jgi:hypothetical protein